MNNPQLYKRGFWLLLILNVLVILNFLVIMPMFIHGKKAPRPHTESILDLDQEQTAKFKEFAKEHHNEIKSLNTDHKAILPSYFASLVEEPSGIDRDSLVANLQHIERQKLEVTYKHFQDIKSILTQEQLDAFPEFVEQSIFRVLGNKNGKKRRKGKRAPKLK